MTITRGIDQRSISRSLLNINIMSLREKTRDKRDISIMSCYNQRNITPMRHFSIREVLAGTELSDKIVTEYSQEQICITDKS
jgi:hypothetical protein